MNSAPIVRFAPSPTGRIHIGNARTALLNWLFVRRDLERIFAFRSERLAQILCQKSTIIAQGAPGADALDR